MKHALTKKIFVFHAVVLALLCLNLSTAQAAAPRAAELVADAETGRILHGQNINSLRHPASLTKVMTLYMTFYALEQGVLRMDQSLPVSWNAAGQPPSRIGLNEGESIKVRDAIFSLVTESANDVSVVLAEAIGGTEARFAKLMTQRARALGMTRTVYTNANGLPDDNQVTTAFDQAILARATLYHFPKYYKFFRTRSFTYDGVAHRNHNRLMTRYEGMDGIKTGYIRASGFNLMASAKRNDKRLIAIVFGGRTAKSRDNRVAEVLDYGFNRLYTEAKSGKRFASLPATVTPDGIDVTRDPPEAKAAVDDTVAQGDEDASSAAEETAQPVAKAKPKKWEVQIGSFSNRKQGLAAIASAKKKAPSYLKGAVAKVVPAKSGKKTIYRARLSGLDEKSARLACDSLTNKGNTCLTLPPQG